jgi:hypothetical protein
MITDLEWIREKAVMAYFKVPGTCLEVQKKTK